MSDVKKTNQGTKRKSETAAKAVAKWRKTKARKLSTRTCAACNKAIPPNSVSGTTPQWVIDMDSFDGDDGGWGMGNGDQYAYCNLACLGRGVADRSKATTEPDDSSSTSKVPSDSSSSSEESDSDFSSSSSSSESESDDEKKEKRKKQRRASDRIIVQAYRDIAELEDDRDRSFSELDDDLESLARHVQNGLRAGADANATLVRLQTQLKHMRHMAQYGVSYTSCVQIPTLRKP
jgi:hypothetical protein